MSAIENDCILSDVPESEYHAMSRLSYSGLKEMKRGPNYYRHAKDNPSEDTEDRRRFRAVHMLLAEPERAACEIMVIDGRRVGAVKAEVEAAEMAGKLVLKPDDYDQMRRVADFCRAHPRVSEILSAGVGEQSLFWKDPETGVLCKARTDWLNPVPFIGDWKCFDQLDDYSIEGQIRKMKYHWQAGFYTEGLSIITGKECADFFNVFIRTVDPIDCRVIQLAPEKVVEARALYRPYVKRYAECLENKSWPSKYQDVDVFSPKFFE